MADIGAGSKVEGEDMAIKMGNQNQVGATSQVVQEEKPLELNGNIDTNPGAQS